ncbi:MAG: hypothetical protein Q7U86_09140 [Draconibacterium sp.]|nr:hypothetical protein [Draconibacterium sp.]MDP3238303.1 hypothetical protein [Myxococcales bacterium]
MDEVAVFLKEHHEGYVDWASYEENQRVIRQNLMRRYGDDDIARVLNKLGRRTGKGMAWSQVGVKTARRLYNIAGHVRTVEDPDVLSFNGAARHLAVSPTTIKRMVGAGVLAMSQAAPFAPWEIQRSALDSTPVRRVVAQLKKTGRLELPGEAPEMQQKLFQ